MSALSTGQYFGHTASRSDAAAFSVCCLEHSVARRLPMHTHGRAFFSMPLEGRYREEAGKRSIDYEPFTIVYHPPSTAHVDEIGPGGARFLMIEVDENLVRGDGVPDSLASGYPTILPRSASWQALGLLSPDDPASGESIALELLVAVGSGPRIHARPRWLVDVLDRVRDESHAPPSTTELAAGAGVHPVHLARVVRQATGMNVAEIVRQRRVEQAARRLSGDTPLASIALECGFADQPHFTRSFRAVTGLTPGDVRKLLKAR